MTLTATIRSRIVAAIRHFMKIVDPSFKENSDVEKTVEGALASAIAPEIKQAERLGEQATREGCPLTASSPDDNDLGQLYNWGRIKMGRLPYPATDGTYTVSITGLGEIPAGAMLVDPTTDLVYLLQSKVTAPGSGIIKSTGKGSAVALEVNDTLSFDQRYTGVDQDVTVSSIVSAPVDKESDADYLLALSESFRNTPRGGAKGDYRVWCGALTGLYKIYPYTGSELGSMIIYVQALKTQANPDGIPTGDLIDDVREAIEDAQPETAGDLTVRSVISEPAIVTVTGLSDNGFESQVEDIISEYIYGYEPFISGVDLETERRDLVTKGEILGAIIETILPVTITDISITVNGLSYDNETLPQGTVLNLDSVVFS